MKQNFENSETIQEEAITPEKQNQNHSKIYTKLIIHTVIAVILGFMMITHDLEKLTASEKFMIFTCTVLSAVLLRIEPFLKEWLEKDSGKESIHFLKNGIGEIWAIILAFSIIVTAMFGFRCAANYAYENYIVPTDSQTFQPDDILYKRIFLGTEDSATIYGIPFSTFGEEWGLAQDAVIDKTEIINFFFPYADKLSQDKAEKINLMAEKLADFLNTELHSPFSRFFFKWMILIFLCAMIICLNENLGILPALKVLYIKLTGSAVAIGAGIGGLLTFILPIAILIYTVYAFMIVTIPFILILVLWGIFLPASIILNLIISFFLFLFEKIKEMFSKDKAEPFVS